MEKKTSAVAAMAVTVFLLCPGILSAGGSYDWGVTIWLVVVNYPEACSETPCTEADIFGSLPDNPTKATVCYLTGQSVRPNGKATFAGRLGEGTNHACFFPDDANPYGLKDSYRAEVHPIVQEHGAALPRKGGLDEQVAYFFGACNPDCVDVQFAIHVPGAQSPEGVSMSDVYRFKDGSQVRWASSTLYREKGGIRVTLHTTLNDALDK